MVRSIVLKRRTKASSLSGRQAAGKFSILILFCVLCSADLCSADLRKMQSTVPSHVHFSC
eukprot:scaffold17630_cov92-Skeletonema_dohrnii-CCMP3373.AAC.5